MKILLIEPAKAPVTLGGEDFFIYEPLALEYIAAGVVKDHEVRILDLRLEKNLQGVLEEFCPDIVGITAYTVHVNTVRRLFDTIKEWNPNVLTVVGGHHATILPEDFLSPSAEYPVHGQPPLAKRSKAGRLPGSVDLIVLGEGVLAFREIVRRFERGEGFDGIPGIAFARGGSLARTEVPATVELDAFPFPERSLTARYRQRYYSEWMKPLASMRTSKGCPYRCNFCALWKITGGRYLVREPAKIVEELATIDEPFVFFADDESLVDAARMDTLARLIKEAGIRKQYFLYGRSDTVARNAGLLERWREIGLDRVFVGLEFFRDEDLQQIRKGSTISDNEKAVRILQDLGIEIYASFIVRPEFSRDDFAAFGRYCRKLALTFATFAVLTPLPGTDFYKEVEAQLITHNYDYFDFVHTLLPTELPLKEFYQAFSQLYRTAVPLSRGLSLVTKFPWKEILPALAMSFRWQNLLRKAYLDYGDAGGIPTGSRQA